MSADTELVELLPWQWPEEVWRGKVEQVRAGRNLKPAKWKNGARCAIALYFDVDHETNELRDGGKSVGRLSWGQYGNRVGVPRILKLLKEQDIQASFFVPAVTALLYPDEQRQRMRSMRSLIQEFNVYRWAGRLLLDAARMRNRRRVTGAARPAAVVDLRRA